VLVYFGGYLILIMPVNLSELLMMEVGGVSRLSSTPPPIFFFFFFLLIKIGQGD
jgi:hypothetical protein